MTNVSERTKLLSDDRQPHYTFDSTIFRAREKRLRKFQLCFCSILAVAFIIGFVAIVAYSIHYKYTDDDTPQNSTVNNTAIAENSLLTLLAAEWPLSDSRVLNTTLNDETEWGEALNSAHQTMKAKDNLERNTPALELDSPSYRHQKVTATSEMGRTLARYGYLQEYAAKYIMTRNSSLFNSSDTDATCVYTSSGYCDTEKMECNKYQMYRTYNGLCNNLKYPKMFGVAYRPFRRVFPADYADDELPDVYLEIRLWNQGRVNIDTLTNKLKSAVRQATWDIFMEYYLLQNSLCEPLFLFGFRRLSSPRKSKRGLVLPSARMVSMVVHRPYYKDDPKFSVMLAVWGQFMDHDITATALSQGANGTAISCCTDFRPMHPECFPVILDPKDPYLKDNITCMEFVRSAPALQCCLGPREQMNQMTAFIDGSVIYGPDAETVQKLRTLKDGLLKMYVTEDNRTLLPLSEDETDGCNRLEEKMKGRYCFMAGDSRSNENLHLTTMHLLWARQHNKLAGKLKEMNPQWDDERIFQEARKIVGAQMQHITYKEFLPILFGPKIMAKFKLAPLPTGYYDGYDEDTDPSISNSFAAAAFRFAHTIIPGLMKKLAKDTSSMEFVQLHKMLFDPFTLYEPGELDRALRGAINTSIEASDTYFTNELKEHLFERNDTQNTKACGLDLVSLNIQRGRDHGIPGYTKWREHCKLGRPRRFSDLRGHIDDDSIINIQAIYSYIDDVDLYTGGVSEMPLEDSIIGPTITCLLLDQFIRLKNGDRFWYENNHPQAFRQGQLNEIRKTSLAGILCDNADDIQVVQRKVMEGNSEENQNTHCSNIPRPDLKLWKEEQLHRIKVPTDEISVKKFSKNKH